MVKSVRRKFRIVPAVVNLGIDILGLMVEALGIGNWAGIMKYFGGRYTKHDVVFTIYGMARRYLDLGKYTYYRAIKITLKQIFKQFGGINSVNMGA